MKTLCPILIGIMFCLGISCSKKDIVTKITQKNGVTYLNSTFSGKPTRTLKEIKRLRFTDEYVNWYLHGSDRIATLSSVIHKNNKSYITIWDTNLNKLSEHEIKNGKGPGELSTWIPGMGMNVSSLFFLDSQKTSVEEFDHTARFKESYVFYDARFRFGFGNTKLHFFNNTFYISPISNYVMVAMNIHGELVYSIPPENPDAENGYLLNLNEHTADAEGNIYMIMRGLENRYEIRKYNNKLQLQWVHVIDDGLLSTLSSKVITFPNKTFELEGGQVASAIEYAHGNIYIVRGVNGIASWKWENESKILMNAPIPHLKNGFIDVFDAASGGFRYRIDAPFLNTMLRYKLNIIGDSFYFAAPFSRDNDKNPIIDCNVIISAVIEPDTPVAH